MMKRFFLLTIFTALLLSAKADHIKGGFFTYRYLGPGISNPSYFRYRVTLTVYMECNPPPSPGQLSNPINFSFFNAGTSEFLQNVSVPISAHYVLSKGTDDECISGNQAICFYDIVVYDLPTIELAPLPNGYTVSYQRCCRIAGVQNITNSNSVGNTWSITIPGSSAPLNGITNSSPQFPINDTVVVCTNSQFQYAFQAFDPDGDSLSYHFCNAWIGGSQSNSAPATADPPPYISVPYAFPFSGSQPLGAGVTVNSATGLVGGMAPATPGEYVITVCVDEFRQGVPIASSRKELHVKVGSCVPIQASLDPQYLTCDGYTLTFSNNSPSTLIQIITGILA